MYVPAIKLTHESISLCILATLFMRMHFPSRLDLLFREMIEAMHVCATPI